MIIPFKKLSTLIGMVSTTLSTKTMQSSAVSLKNASVEMRSSGSRFRPIFWFTCVDDFVTGTVKGRFVGIPRITDASHQEFFVPGIAVGLQSWFLNRKIPPKYTSSLS